MYHCNIIRNIAVRHFGPGETKNRKPLRIYLCVIEYFPIAEIEPATSGSLPPSGVLWNSSGGYLLLNKTRTGRSSIVLERRSIPNQITARLITRLRSPLAFQIFSRKHDAK